MASRSAAPIATEAHVAPLPAKILCREEASPASRPHGLQRAVGPRAEGERAAVGDDEGAAHRILIAGPAPAPAATAAPVASSCGALTKAAAGRRGDAFEGRPQHVDRLGAQLVQRPVAVDALAEVDLGQAIHPEMLRHVDQQAELDPVAVREAELLEDPAVRRGLARQRLAHP